ncbi:hypothetical protein [Roseibium algae]|uniref:Uncharacterized protein n=1 Tax=Roseibium algae TaxID=3123038 RepID=A0ABU8TJA4_9HYPH
MLSAELNRDMKVPELADVKAAIAMAAVFEVVAMSVVKAVAVFAMVASEGRGCAD